MAHVGPGDVPCPDPLAHEHSNQLAEQASSAALYATDPARHTGQDNVLGPDGKLSSHSAATSLKYARPQDLPSYPSHGGLADSAGKAALMAKDYKMQELWHPEESAAGSKAAILAHRDGAKVDLWQPSASKAGNSAANLAMHSKDLSPQLDQGYTQQGRQNALKAATLSAKLDKSDLLPPQGVPDYPDAKNSASNALSAATVSHRSNSVKTAPDGWNSEANQVARVKNLHVNPRYFTEVPGIDINPEETRHQAALRASALSMAKQMYETQKILPTPTDASREAANLASTKQQTSPPKDIKQEALKYLHLQDEAYKLAQERLRKIDKNFESAKYREYYGLPSEPTPKKGLSRLSHTLRHNNSINNSEAALPSDEERARQIRAQTSALTTAVDTAQRSSDRAKLMALASQRVQTQMASIDAEVYANTGKVPPALQEEWEQKAQKRAKEEQERAAAQTAPQAGQRDVGGGRYISQAEVEAIAAERLKPTLEEISKNAERRRERDEEVRKLKVEGERRRVEEKAKQREEKEKTKRVRRKTPQPNRNKLIVCTDEEKAASKKEKHDEKAASKAKKQEDKLARKQSESVDDEKRASMLGRLSTKLHRKSKPTQTQNRESGDKVSDLLSEEENLSSSSSSLSPHRPALTSRVSGHYTDPGQAVAPSKPDLERHISHIGHSDSESESEGRTGGFMGLFGKMRTKKREESEESSNEAISEDAAAFAAGGRKKRGQVEEVEDGEDDGEEDEFQDAKDHFDEPKQRRGTKFREEVD
ncbi:hypothetical protein K470DRAFT_266580 [Piedraia hortae CBS 480.64]|uniref:Eisosome protein 1 n=1 Tax=Piedraia hortae CBS 480.64 TaxID=1314780 RepID=A0A6A7BR90_9PEZI|nr:hypothetical protein K470DRAFT_266580 [Piedraia hortae CBS 480.64]